MVPTGDTDMVLDRALNVLVGTDDVDGNVEIAARSVSGAGHCHAGQQNHGRQGGASHVFILTMRLQSKSPIGRGIVDREIRVFGSTNRSGVASCHVSCLLTRRDRGKRSINQAADDGLAVQRLQALISNKSPRVVDSNVKYLCAS